MKTIRVRYFAAFRDMAGVEAESVTTTAQTTGELFGEMARRYEGLTRLTATLVAVNDRMSDWDTRLNEGDEVLFFPPVAGG